LYIVVVKMFLNPLCCPVRVPQILLGGLAPVGLAATAVSPAVLHTPEIEYFYNLIKIGLKKVEYTDNVMWSVRRSTITLKVPVVLVG
jgi:hypothetical protein